MTMQKKKNYEKYKTADGRVKAFHEFIKKRCGMIICEECEVHTLCAVLADKKGGAK